MKFLKKIQTKEFWIETKIKLIAFYKELYSDKKKVAIRFSTALLVMTIIFLTSFLLRQNAIAETHSGTVTRTIISNTGISFGLLQDNASAVYVLQVIPVIFSFIGIFHSRYVVISFGLAIVFSAGLSNVLDRAIPDHFGTFIQGADPSSNIAFNGVVDYWQINGQSAIFNFPDVMIIVGIIIVFIYSFVVSWIEANQKLRDEEAKEAEAKKSTENLTQAPKKASEVPK